MSAEHHGTGQYQFRVGGHLDSSWTDWFEGMALIQENDGTTSLCGPVLDQAALHGLLAKVRDIGATLIAVNLLEDQDPRTKPPKSGAGQATATPPISPNDPAAEGGAESAPHPNPHPRASNQEEN
jgi:hypothetical protein